MASPEGKRGGIIVEGTRKFSKLTLGTSLAVAGVGFLVAPPVVGPALTLAAVDGVQLYAINKYQNSGKNKASMKESAYGKHMSSVSKENKFTPLRLLFPRKEDYTEKFR